MGVYKFTQLCNNRPMPQNHYLQRQTNRAAQTNPSIIKQITIKYIPSLDQIYIAPNMIQDETLKEFGARPIPQSRTKGPLNQPQFTHQIPAFYPTLELMSKYGINFQLHSDSDSDSDPDTQTYIQTQLRQQKLSQYLQHADTLTRTPQQISQEQWDKPLPHQKVGVGFLVSRPRAILTFTPGLGKSATSIIAADVTQSRRILVIAPLTLHGTWRYEIKKWSSQPNSPNTQSTEANPRWTITNPERIEKQMMYKPPEPNQPTTAYDLIIIDESVLYKNPQSQRTNNLQKLISNHKPKHAWMLSGAPIKAFADDLFGQLQVLMPHVFTSYWRFARQWCILQDTPWGTKIVGNKNPKLLQEYLVDIMLTRTPDQLLDHNLDQLPFPGLNLETIYVEPTDKQHKIIEELNLTANLVTDDHVNPIKITAAISLLTRISQAISSPTTLNISQQSAKTQTALSLLETLQGPTIVWFQYTKALDNFVDQATKLKYKVRSIQGSTPHDQRQKAIDAFQNNELDVIAIQLDTGRYGLSLTAARNVIYHDRSFDLDAWIQSTHRVRRLSSTHEATGYVLHSGYTDFLIDKIIKYKVASLAQLDMTDILDVTYRTSSSVPKAKTAMGRAKKK